MNYDELPAYGGLPPRSNGRAVIRSTNAGAAAPSLVTWQDMSATIGSAPSYRFTRGIHPDQHAVVFDPVDPGIAFVGSDGGVVRIDIRSSQDKSAACDPRRFVYTPGQRAVPLAPADLVDCQRLLSGIPQTITPINDGLNTIQFQSLSFNPSNPHGSAPRRHAGQRHLRVHRLTDLGRVGRGRRRSVGLRQGRSDDPLPQLLRRHARGELPQQRLQGVAGHLRPAPDDGRAALVLRAFIADPRVGGRAFIGLEHVWRTDDNGCDPAYLEAHCNALHLDTSAPKPCGDWTPMGANLTGSNFGSTRLGQFVVATERAPSDAGTLWAGTRIGRVFIYEQRRRIQPEERPLGTPRHADDAGTVRLGDRDRSRRSDPRLDLLLRL